MTNLFREIKFGFQRMFRGYSDDIKWGFSDYFNIAIKPLEEFCLDELDNTEHMKLNPKRCEIYTRTLELIMAFREENYEDQFEHPNSESDLWEYVGKHISYYWN